MREMLRRSNVSVKYRKQNIVLPMPSLRPGDGTSHVDLSAPNRSVPGDSPRLDHNSWQRFTRPKWAQACECARGRKQAVLKN